MRVFHLFFLPWLVHSFATFPFANNNKYKVKQVVTDSDVLNVASFRNGLCNPQELVAKQQAKQDAIDTKQSALNGAKVGLFLVGPLFGLAAYVGNDYSIERGGMTFAATAFISATALALNNLSGGRVYVMTEAEATNRILVDYAESLSRKIDVGFVATSNKQEKYVSCGGIVATADVQLRNSKQSTKFTRKGPSSLPPHVHMKNMMVDVDQRRNGVAQSLLKEIEMYAKKQTDAELVTLEVEGKNEPAVRLYEKCGYQIETSILVSTRGRRFMSKRI